jgi:hypothetical protein
MSLLLNFAFLISRATRGTLRGSDIPQSAALCTIIRSVPYFFIMFIALSGDSNTGMIAVQLGKKMAAKVIAVSKDNWVKTDFGAYYIIDEYNRIVDRVEEITEGKMADVVLNSSNI